MIGSVVARAADGGAEGRDAQAASSPSRTTAAGSVIRRSSVTIRRSPYHRGDVPTSADALPRQTNMCQHASLRHRETEQRRADEVHEHEAGHGAAACQRLTECGRTELVVDRDCADV